MSIPSKYIQHNIPLSAEEQDLQRRRMEGEPITPETLKQAAARSVKAHWDKSGKPMSDAAREFVEGWPGK